MEAVRVRETLQGRGRGRGSCPRIDIEDRGFGWSEQAARFPPSDSRPVISKTQIIGTRRPGARIGGMGRKKEVHLQQSDDVPVPDWLKLLDQGVDGETMERTESNASSSLAMASSLSAYAASRPRSALSNKGLSASIREARVEMDRARKDRGEESVLLASRPKIDEELLARDVIVADLQEQLVEARALISRRRVLYARKEFKAVDKLNELQKRLEELSAQNTFFRDAMASGKHPAGKEVQESLMKMINRERDQQGLFQHLLPSKESTAEHHGDGGSARGRKQSHFSTTESGESGETGGGGGGGGGVSLHKSAFRRVSTETVGGSFNSNSSTGGGHGTLAKSGSFKLQSKRMADGSMSIASPLSAISSTSPAPSTAPRPRVRERSVGAPDLSGLASNNRGKEDDVFKTSAAAAHLMAGLRRKNSQSHGIQLDGDRMASLVHDGLYATHGSTPMSVNTTFKTVSMALASSPPKTLGRGSDSVGGLRSVNEGGVHAGGGAAYSGGLQEEMAGEQKGSIARSDWLSSFHAGLAAVKAAKGGLPGVGGLASLAARQDYARHSPMLQEEAHYLLEGVAEDSKGFQESVDSPDPRHRAVMLRDVSDMLKMLGLLSDVLHTANALSHTPLDLETTCNSLISHVKRLVDAAKIRLFLVDQAKQTVSEWDDVNGKTGPPRSYHATVHRDRDDEYEQALFSAKTGEGSGHWQGDQRDELGGGGGGGGGGGSSAIICEPVMRGGLVVAVVVCKKYEEEAQGGAMPVAASHRKAFTALDGLVLRMLCEHCGVLFHRFTVFDGALLTGSRTMKVMTIARRDYTYTAEESFALTLIQLKPCMDLLQGRSMVLYMTVENAAGGGGGKQLWTLSNDGLGMKKTILYGEGVAGWVAQHEECVILDSPQQDDRFDAYIDTGRRKVIPRRFAGEGVGNFTSLVVDPALDVQSLVAVPIKKLDGTMLGVVMVLNKRGDSFDSTDARLLRLHCQQVIVTMSGPWQLGKLKSAAQPIVGGQAMSPPKAGEEGGRKVVHETVGEALKRTKRLVGCEEALLLRVEGNVLRLRSPPIKVPMTDPLMGYVASTGVCITMSDAEADSRFSLSLKNALGVKTRNLMCVPVLLEGSITGVLLCLNKINSKINSQDFTHQDETIASVLAKQVGATCSAHGLAERRVMRLQTQMQSCTRPPGFQGNWVGMPHDMDALEEIATAVHV